jgi:hypothetical protein
MSDWLQNQIQAFEKLQGKTVKRWVGIEMALRETDDGIPEFRHDSVRYFQMSRIDAELKDEQPARFVTSQGKEVFGLIRYDDMSDVVVHDEEDWGSFLCARVVNELPTGKINVVKVFTESNVISEVRLQIDADEIGLYAGEIYEDFDQKYSVRFLAECVLVQLNGERPEVLSFSPGG